MPRTKAARKGAFAQQKEQAQLDEELIEFGQHETLNDVNNASSAANLTPSSPIGRAMGIDSPSKSHWLSALLPSRFLGGTPRKNALEKPQDAPPVKEGEEAERTDTRIRQTSPRLEPSTPTSQPVATTPNTLKSPSQAASSPAKPAKRRRLASSEREDVYMVPVETAADHFRLEEKLTDRPAKRIKRVGKAKSPLTIAKTSKGSIVSRLVRQTRNNYTTQAADAGASADVPGSVPVKGVLNPIESEKIRRKRGRPRKNKEPESRAVREPVVTTSNQTTTAGHAVAMSVGTASYPAIALEASGNVDAGISPILLNPSPIKVIRQEVQRAASAPTATQKQKPSKLKGLIQVSNGIPEISADEEDEEKSDDDNAQKNTDYLDKTEFEVGKEAADQPSTEPRTTPFDPHLLDIMWEAARRVGQKYDRKGNIWLRDVKKEKLSTRPGERMITRLNILISSYEKMQTLKESRDKHGFREAHRKVENIVDSLSEETKVILSERFHPDYDSKEAKGTLTDLYFNILPELIHALKQAVAVYNIEGSIETAALQEILKLVDLLYDLASGAITQPKEIQPRPAGSTSYQISKPTRLNMPKIRDLQTSISAELGFRKREEERAKKELLLAELQRGLPEAKEREAAEICRKRAERRRLQGKSWWDVQNDFLPSPWNRVLQTDLARLEASRKGKGRQESVELGYPRMRVVERRRARSEESRSQSDQSVERISVFPANNIKENSSMSSLSKEDTLVFIDCMRFEQGADRYERAAEQISRSMDDVFTLAKEFQEAMDIQHQEGNFNEARDSWTYSVWVDQE